MRIMPAWCFLPVLLMLHQVAGHSLLVPQEHDRSGQGGGGQDVGGQGGGGQEGGGQEGVGQNGGGQEEGYQDGGGQDRNKHNNQVAMTRINQVNSSYIRKGKCCPATTPTTTPSCSGDPPLILKRVGLESSGRRLISSIGKTKSIAFFFPAIFFFFFFIFFEKK